MTVSKHYLDIIENYRPLVRDSKDVSSLKMNPALIERAYELCEAVTPQSRDGKASDDHCPVYTHAVGLINTHGVYVDVGTAKSLSHDYVQRCAMDEVNALVYTACIVVTELEHENGHPFRPENMDKMIIKAMDELLAGKEAIQAKQREAGSIRVR